MGKGQIKLIVGLRDPFDLAFSLWSFLAQIGAEGKRVELRMGRALAAIQECNQTLAADPTLLLQLSSAQLTAYRLCLDDRKRARQHFWIYGGLYGLHMLGWLQLHFSAKQFLFVKMTSYDPWLRRTHIAHNHDSGIPTVRRGPPCADRRPFPCTTTSPTAPRKPTQGRAPTDSPTHRPTALLPTATW